MEETTGAAPNEGAGPQGVEDVVGAVDGLDGNPRARSVRAREWLSRNAWPVLLGLATAWDFGPELAEMAGRWSGDPRYSHGFLVPLFALALLWERRALRPSADGASEPGRWAYLGLALVASGVVLRLTGVHYYVTWLSAAALLPTLAGLALLAGGLPVLRWAWPSLAFLAFMIPLPYRVEVSLGAPLQAAATACSTFAMQALGLPAVAEGNVIAVNGARIGVVEACNGLGMLYTFLAMATGLALILRRPWPDRLLILASALPVALAANVARITATGLLREWAGPRLAEAVYHDLAGWLMMPMALVLIGAELRLLDWLLTERQGDVGPGGPHPLTTLMASRLGRPSLESSGGRRAEL